MSAWQFSFEGATWGLDTSIDVVAVDGLLGFVATHANAARLGHGSRPGRMRAPVRAFTMDLEIGSGITSMEELANVMTLARIAWAPRDDEQPLTFQVDGEVAKRIYCRPLRHNLPMDNAYSFAFVRTAIQWEAADPLHYSDALHTATTGRTQPGAGIALPMTLPMTLPAATSTGVASVTNAGTAPAGWAVRLDGPLVNPVITHQEQGRALDFSGNGGLSIAAGQYVDVISDGRHVLLGGASDLRIKLRLPESRWFQLDQGVNSVQLEADSGAGTMTVSWRDAWWG